MTQTVMSPPHNATLREAQANYRRNAAEIASLQPQLRERLADASAEVDWLFARDGSLSAMLPGERWWGDCSLPRRAGQFMFKSVEIHGVVASFLNPIHGAHLAVTLGRLEPQQAIVAIVPDPKTLWIMLHCHDFSTDLQSHRLWFVTGNSWETDLAGLFTQNPGLPTPSQFIRAISTDNGPADALIEPAQKIFAREANRRAQETRAAVAGWRRGATQKLCVIAPSRFRLWNDAPTVLAGIAREAGAVCQFDSDDPASASPLALAQATAECDAVVAANLSRADLPEIVPDEMPWTTWITLGRIPEREKCAKHDRLMLADEAWMIEAHGLGWKENETELACWPAVELPQDQSHSFIALIVDTRPLDPPKHVREYSSHLLLWELVQDELVADPFLIGSLVPRAAEQYLKSRVAQLRVAEESLNKTFFVEHLIVPAYQQGLARLLIEQGVPVRLYGRSWEEIPEFAGNACGTVESRQQFAQIVAKCRALVHVWPSDTAHPIDAIGRPVLRPFGRPKEQFLRDPIGAASARCAIELSPQIILSQAA